jgi:hypothetical protein
MWYRITGTANVMVPTCRASRASAVPPLLLLGTVVDLLLLLLMLDLVQDVIIGKEGCGAVLVGHHNLAIGHWLVRERGPLCIETLVDLNSLVHHILGCCRPHLGLSLKMEFAGVLE